MDGRLFASTRTGGALLGAATGEQVAAGPASAPDLVRGACAVDRGSSPDSFLVHRLTW